jgi:hypothetical protein
MFCYASSDYLDSIHFQVGFVYFGSMLAKRGDIQIGSRFTQLARSLLDKLAGSKDCSGEVELISTELDC